MHKTPITRREALRLMGTMAGTLATQAMPTFAGQPMQTTLPLTRKIPSSNEELPLIGLGSWQTFDVGTSDAERAPLERVLRIFSELGGKVIDSSPMYGRSESVIGDLSAQLNLRDKFFFATKVWITGRQAGIRQMEESLAKMRTSRMDLMQVHNLLDADIHLKTLREWKASGRIRYIGVTHYHAGAHADLAKAMAAYPLDFIQINYSVAEREAEKRVLPLALERGIAVIANRPFAGGDLLRRLRGRPLPDWAADIDCSSWAQILLKFIVSHPAVTCAIPATSKEAHLRDNMGAALGRMPDAAMREKIARAVV